MTWRAQLVVQAAFNNSNYNTIRAVATHPDPNLIGAGLVPSWRLSKAHKGVKEISRMDRCRTHRCPTHSALRFSWAEDLLAEEVA